MTPGSRRDDHEMDRNDTCDVYDGLFTGTHHTFKNGKASTKSNGTLTLSKTGKSPGRLPFSLRFIHFTEAPGKEVGAEDSQSQQKTQHTHIGDETCEDVLVSCMTADTWRKKKHRQPCERIKASEPETDAGEFYHAGLHVRQRREENEPQGKCGDSCGMEMGT